MATAQYARMIQWIHGYTKTGGVSMLLHIFLQGLI